MPPVGSHPSSLTSTPGSSGLVYRPSPGQLRPAARISRGLEPLVVGLMLVSGIVAWATGIHALGYDYDEVMRGHSTWLTAQGLRPYRDFLDCHPPYFAILTPVVRASAGDPCVLLWTLRIVSAIGNTLFLASLAALGAAVVPAPGKWAAIFGLAFVAFQPTVLPFLAEFRIDGWGYALVGWGLYRFRRSARGGYHEFELGALTGIATLFFCPKLALLAPLVVIADLIFARVPARTAIRGLLGFFGGAASAGILFVCYLLWQGIDLSRTFELLVRYNAISNANLGVRFGLFQAILANRLLCVVTGACILGWGLDQIRHRNRPDPYLVAVAVWLLLQALLVSYPYKQYYAPWFLVASCFVVHVCGRLSDWLGPGRLIVFLVACAFTIVADAGLCNRLMEHSAAQSDQTLIRWMNRVTRPEDRVVGSPPLHPIDRFDTFFLSFNTFDIHGFDAQRILAQLPSFRQRITPARFRDELEENPPALVVLSGDWRIVPYPPGQREALGAFLRTRGYQAVERGPARFALRPDRFEQAKREGLVEVDAGR
jgi:hypothetical protein